MYSFLLYTRLFVHVFSVESSSGVIMNRISHKTSVVHTCACVEHKIMVYEANFSNFFAKIPWKPLFWAWFSALFSALWANFVRKTLRYFLRYAFWIFLSALHFFQTHNATHQHWPEGSPDWRLWSQLCSFTYFSSWNVPKRLHAQRITSTLYESYTIFQVGKFWFFHRKWETKWAKSGVGSRWVGGKHMLKWEGYPPFPPDPGA